MCIRDRPRPARATRLTAARAVARAARRDGMAAEWNAERNMVTSREPHLCGPCLARIIHHTAPGRLGRLDRMTELPWRILRARGSVAWAPPGWAASPAEARPGLAAEEAARASARAGTAAPGAPWPSRDLRAW